MNRHARRAEAARAGLGHGPVLFQSLDRLVALAHLRASQWLYDGRVLPGVQARINACRYLYAITPEISARLIYTRDIGHHSAGWWKNPDYERCFHLSVSFCVNPTDEPLPFMRKEAEIIARAFWPREFAKAWVEKPYTPEGRHADVWHYRLFCDPSWAPLQPRGEVYSREFTESGWRSFSDIHGDVDMAAIDAPFLLEGRD